MAEQIPLSPGEYIRKLRRGTWLDIVEASATSMGTGYDVTTPRIFC